MVVSLMIINRVCIIKAPTNMKAALLIAVLARYLVDASYINEFNDNSDTGTFVEIASRVVEDWTGVVYHYDGSGLYLGFTNITAPEESPTSFRGFTYAAYNASSLIPRGGGAMCYVPASANGDGISTLAYGASYVSQLPAVGNECDNLLVEETFLVRTAPGAGESYSRVGRGVEPEDYMWQVTEATPGVYNGGQVVPNSCSRDNLCRRGNRYRQATFLMHRRRGGECEVRCVSKSKVGYMQMYGWACGECEEEETEPPEEGATDEPEEENKGFTGIWD